MGATGMSNGFFGMVLKESNQPRINLSHKEALDCIAAVIKKDLPPMSDDIVEELIAMNDVQRSVFMKKFLLDQAAKIFAALAVISETKLT